MIFKRQNKFFFLLLTFVFSIHCHLQIGEAPPLVPKYQMPVNLDDCSKINYKDEFRSYFLDVPEGNDTYSLSGENWSKALNCIGLEIVRIKDLINHEYFEKRELINFLNQDFIKKGNMESIITNVTDPAYFDNYILIKDAIVHLIKGKPEDSSSDQIDDICQSERTGTAVFSKQEVDIFVDFLKDFAEFSLTVEKSAYEVFNWFFKRDSSSGSLLYKSQLKDFDGLKISLLSFLSSYFNKDFPAYSQFLSQRFSKEFFDIADAGDFPSQPQFYLEVKDAEELLYPLLDTAQLPLSGSDDLTIQNVKYMMLHIYLTKAFFTFYDVNQDFVLSAKELEPLSCVIRPVVSLIVSARLSGQWEAIQSFYSQKAISNYIIRYQKVPSGPWDLDFLIYRTFNKPEVPDNLYYEDVSRLVSVFLLNLFDKVHTYF